jgi:hypothetical protein
MLGSLIHGLPEFLSEISLDRLLKELIYTHFISLTLLEGITTDVPTMKIKGPCAVAQRRDPYRIEPA